MAMVICHRLPQRRQLAPVGYSKAIIEIGRDCTEETAAAAADWKQWHYTFTFTFTLSASITLTIGLLSSSPSPFCGWQWTEVHVSEWCRWSKYNVTITGILMKMGNTGSTGGAGEKTTSGKCQRWPASLFVCVCVCACVCWEVFLSVDTDNDSNAHTHRYSHQQIAFAWAESAGKGRRKKEREKTKEKERKRVPMRTSARMQEKTLGNELK